MTSKSIKNPLLGFARIVNTFLIICNLVIGNILEDYDFIKELGSGTYGIVYEAVHRTTSKESLEQ